MAATTYLGLYDDFQQAQRASLDLRSNGIQLTDVGIVARRDAPRLFNKLHHYFDSNKRLTPQVDTAGSDVDYIRPIIVGALVGMLPMIVVALMNNSILFGSPALTLMFQLGFGALAGAFFGAMIIAIEAIGADTDNQAENLSTALEQGMTVLVVRDQGKYDPDTVKIAMRNHKPRAVTEADSTAWIGQRWLKKLNSKAVETEGGEDTIAGERHRAYAWQDEDAKQPV